MLESIPFIIIISTALGFLAGIGIGGGSLLIMWLTIVLNTEYTTARIVNLLFFIPSAIIATIFRWKQGGLNIKKVFPAIIAGCVSAAGFCALSTRLDIQLLQKLFGGLLLITGLRELFYRRKAR